MRYLTYIAWAIGISIICVVQVSVILAVPSLYSLVSLPLAASLLFAIIRRTTVALLFAAITGYILDLYSALPFGAILFSQLASVGALLFMQRNVFKNFAAHAVVINAAVALTVYHLIFALFVTFFKQTNFVSLTEYSFGGYIVQSFGHVGIQLVILVIAFYIAQVLFRYAGKTTLHV